MLASEERRLHVHHKKLDTFAPTSLTQAVLVEGEERIKPLEMEKPKAAMASPSAGAG
jgi:hypothetical protein